MVLVVLVAVVALAMAVVAVVAVVGVAVVEVVMPFGLSLSFISTVVTDFLSLQEAKDLFLI